MTKVVQAFKAGAVAGKGPASISILLDQPFPETNGMTLEAVESGMQQDAERLALALLDTLPGGTLDRLLAELMRHRASSLVVVHPSVNKKG